VGAVTEHFTIEEFGQPARHGQPAMPYPEEWRESRLLPLCVVLEVLRAHLGGAAITVLSGYRSPAYNTAVGGRPASQHMEGRAADITVAGHTPLTVYVALLTLDTQRKIDALGGLGLYEAGGFVHVDVRPRVRRLAQWTGGRVAT
jgi:uncharacterized protein YcbK (DUF882 family)